MELFIGRRFHLTLATLVALTLATLVANWFAFRSTRAASPATGHQHTIGLGVRTADGQGNYSEVRPGDIVSIEAGTRRPLVLANFHGEPGKPITFINSGGIVDIVSNGYAGIKLKNCEYVRLTGTGVSEQAGSPFAEYDQQSGIRVSGGQRGIAGIEGTRYLEIDHVEVAGGSKSGITIKSHLPRDEWTQYGTYLHHNYIHDMGTEGMYIGSSFYDEGLDPVLKGVNISFNLVTRTGWDGIQVGSAVEDCIIRGNAVSLDSQSSEPGQQSGIMNNRGSACDICDNLITDSAASGIYIQGNGGNRIYNNVIVRSGRLGSAGDGGGSGIVVTTGSNTGRGVNVSDNTIVDPNGHGIRFTNQKGTGNTVQNNTIVNPGGTYVSIGPDVAVTAANNTQLP